MVIVFPLHLVSDRCGAGPGLCFSWAKTVANAGQAGHQARRHAAFHRLQSGVLAQYPEQDDGRHPTL